jgi:hypothetical protein
MAATADEINGYLYNIRNAYVEYGSGLAHAQRLGTDELDCPMMKFRVLRYLVRILVDYFDSDDYENVNFFTTEEARDVAQQINNICHTEFMIDF